MLRDLLSRPSTYLDAFVANIERKAGFPRLKRAPAAYHRLDQRKKKARALGADLDFDYGGNYPQNNPALAVKPEQSVINAVNRLARRIRADRHEFSSLRGAAYAKSNATTPQVIALQDYLKRDLPSRALYRVTLKPTLADGLLLRVLARRIAETSPAREFHPAACAYIPDRGEREVVRQVVGHLHSGLGAVLRMDVASFNETVDQPLLLETVQQNLRERRGWSPADTDLFTALLGSYLRRVGEALQSPGVGVGMGSPLTPWLTNVYLDLLDRHLDALGLPFVRYGDDLAVFLRSGSEALDARGQIEEFVRSRLRQGLRDEKISVTDLVPGDPGSSFDFCMHRYALREDGLVGIRIRDATIEKARRAVSIATRIPANADRTDGVHGVGLRLATETALQRVSLSTGWFATPPSAREHGATARIDPPFLRRGWGYWYLCSLRTGEIRWQLTFLDAYIRHRLRRLERALGGDTSRESQFHSRLRQAGHRTLMDAWNIVPPPQDPG